MRTRWLVIAVVTMSLLPAIASARSQIRREPQLDQTHPYAIGAAVQGGLSVGHLVLAFHNPDPIHAIEVPIRVVAETIQYDWLTVEIRNATTTRTLSFVADREGSSIETVRIQPQGLHFETIDLAPLTRDLPAGDYDVLVTWDGQLASAKLTKTMPVPMQCGLAHAAASPKQDSPSRPPFVLGGFAIAALLLGLALVKPAGTAAERVPCSAS